ncbi:hypothetical protein GTY67_34070 [Streptomyces sp. SID8374]|uniref:hypothetical protein n=1 Tax=unclassified Streptomyces TaxID=2593676 RepID=UPI00081E46E9|nr:MULTISPECIES: hypothetical protein [unclassified Streptomyces]MYR93928.1 hypothetical protein [Streptomyces sp. SID4937]MYX18379.1 hypothetical protein [Streptomyces sp. SID8374]SCD61433.1 hypothetical protein GA0115243_1033242 [Streptomyces sp. ScaeMP-e83]
MTVKPRRAALTAALALSLGALSLTACSSDDDLLDYQTDYANHQPLRVTGYPSAGSLRTVQQIVWHLADRDADALAALHTEDGDAGSTARAWIKTYSKDAQGQVTADFLDEGSVRQEVVLHFAESRRTQEITVRINNEAWGVVLDDPAPAAESR